MVMNKNEEWETNMQFKRKYIILIGIPATIVISFACLIKYWNYSIDANCDSDDTRVIALYKANNNLNGLLCNKKFGKIHDLLMESKRNNIRVYVGNNREYFIKDQYDGYYWGLHRRKMLSYRILGDIGIVKNEVRIRHAIMLNMSATQTWYNYWTYKGDKWYLLDFDCEDSTGFQNKVDTIKNIK
jgi:hypothetical protein